MAGKSLLLTLVLCASVVGARAASRDEIVPAGTLLHCTMDEQNFSSKTAQVGDPVLCHLGPISAFGHSLVPRGAMLRAYDKQTGKEVGALWMPAQQSGSPMTYMIDGKQYIVVAVSGGNYSGEYIAFALP